MKILVTGGAGFIGSAVAKALKDKGHEVVVIDNFNEYYDVDLKRARQKVFLEGMKVVEGDITDGETLEKLFAAEAFDSVCHLAAQAGVRYSIEAPNEYVKTNVEGTQMIFAAMQKYKVNRMVFASTSSVYGVDTLVPFTEDAKADHPVSIYAATKRSAELLAYNYFVQYGIETTCLRFFTVYGPWSRPDMAMLKFALKMENGDAIDIYNEGNLRRDFTHIEDIVKGFGLAVEKPLGYEIVNLGNGSAVNLMDFVGLLERELETVAKKNMLPMQTGDVYETYADVEKAERLLGFKSSINLEEGITSFVRWFRNYYQQN